MVFLGINAVPAATGSWMIDLFLFIVCLYLASINYQGQVFYRWIFFVFFILFALGFFLAFLVDLGAHLF